MLQLLTYTINVVYANVYYRCNHSLIYDTRETGIIADLRYGEKDIISPSTLVFAPIKG